MFCPHSENHTRNTAREKAGKKFLGVSERIGFVENTHLSLEIKKTFIVIFLRACLKNSMKFVLAKEVFNKQDTCEDRLIVLYL